MASKSYASDSGRKATRSSPRKKPSQQNHDTSFSSVGSPSDNEDSNSEIEPIYPKIHGVNESGNYSDVSSPGKKSGKIKSPEKVSECSSSPLAYPDLSDLKKGLNESNSQIESPGRGKNTNYVKQESEASVPKQETRQRKPRQGSRRVVTEEIKHSSEDTGSLNIAESKQSCSASILMALGLIGILIVMCHLLKSPAPVVKQCDLKSLKSDKSFPKGTYGMIEASRRDFQETGSPVILTFSQSSVDGKTYLNDFFEKLSSCFEKRTEFLLVDENWESTYLEERIQGGLGQNNALVVDTFHTLSEAGLLTLRKYTDVHDPSMNSKSLVIFLIVRLPFFSEDISKSVYDMTRDYLRDRFKGKLVPEEIDPFLSRVALNPLYLP